MNIGENFIIGTVIAIVVAVIPTSILYGIQKDLNKKEQIEVTKYAQNVLGAPTLFFTESDLPNYEKDIEFESKVHINGYDGIFKQTKEEKIVALYIPKQNITIVQRNLNISRSAGQGAREFLRGVLDK